MTAEHHDGLNIHADSNPRWLAWVVPVAAIGGLIGASMTISITGGRILEGQEVMRKDLAALVTSVTRLDQESASVRTELVRQQGVDQLHDERIHGIDGRVIVLERRVNK